MRVLTVIGTRPEIIRLSGVMKKLKAILGDNYKIIYTNQNSDKNLSDIFFKEFDIQPDFILPALPDSQLHNQFSHYIKYIGEYCESFNPDKVVILGDTNSVLVTTLFHRKGIKVYHIEAGNRCYEKGMVEEINRKIVDNTSYINLCYTTHSKNNLLEEGFKGSKIYVVGNPIKEIMSKYSYLCHGLEEVNNKEILMTIHRTEHMNRENLLKIVQFISYLYIQGYKVKLSLHPRLKDRLEKYNIDISNICNTFTPCNQSQFIGKALESEIIITDSGAVPEEMYYIIKKCIVLRNSYERQELIESGNTVLLSLDNAIVNFDDIVRMWDNIEKSEVPEYEIENTSDRIVNIVMSDL